MASEEPQRAPDAPPADENMRQDSPAPAPSAAPSPRKRPKLDLSVDPRERKRGKTMFGLLVGTLNKAKIEDKERNASDAAKKRQMIEQKLQRKLKKETDSMRRAEDAKKDKTAANRKEEELQLKDSIAKLRRRRLPQLANFLCTSDDIPDTDSSPKPTTAPLALAPRAHPPPIYWLPAKLLPSQEAFLSRRKAEVAEAVAEEWAAFKEEREKGIAEVSELRQKVTEYHKSKDSEMQTEGGAEAADTPAPAKEDDTSASMDVDEPPATAPAPASATTPEKTDAEPTAAPPEPERKAEPIEADDGEDAVEY